MPDSSVFNINFAFLRARVRAMLSVDHGAQRVRTVPQYMLVKTASRSVVFWSLSGRNTTDRERMGKKSPGNAIGADPAKMGGFPAQTGSTPKGVD